MNTSLNGKVALVTGGSSGIGCAVAKRLASEGARVAVVASSSVAKSQTVVDEIEGAGGSAKAYAVDVRDAGAVGELVKQAEADFGQGIDILVNCAGVYYATPAGETDPADTDKMIDINFKGVLNTINAVVPGMKERRSGKIVSISSIAALAGIANFALYCATKAAVSMLTRSLAGELGPYDINVNAVAPGNTKTSMNETFRTDPEHAEYLKAMENITPSNTKFTDPDEIAGVVLFAASDAGRAMHGSVLVMDEGITACL